MQRDNSQAINKVTGIFEIVKVSFEKGTQSTKLPEVPIATLVLGKDPSKITSFLGKTFELIQRDLTGKPGPESVKALSLLAWVLSSPVNNLALPNNYSENVILYSLQCSLQVSLFPFLFFFFYWFLILLFPL